MTTKFNRRYSDLAIPPGEALKEEIEARGMTPEELAGLCGEPVETIEAIFRGRQEITPDLAAKLEKAVAGIKASFWLNLEDSYQETLTRIGQVRPS